MKLKYSILIIFIILILYSVIFFVTYQIYDKERIFEYNLSNGYILKTNNKATFLLNSKDNYIYPDNFPRERIIRYFDNQNILLLECEDKMEINNKKYYKIDTSNDEIIGPLNQKQFLEDLKNYITINYFHWEVVT